MTTTVRDGRIWTLLTAGIAAILLASPVWARTSADEPDKQGASESCKQQPIAPRAQQRLNEAIKLLQSDQLEEADELLDRISERQLGNYGRALAYQLRGLMAMVRDDMPSAAEWLQKSVDAGGFCGEQLTNARLQLGQILTALSRWDAAISQLEQVIAESDAPIAEAYFRIGVAYHQKGDREGAITAARRAVELGGADAQETWLRFLLFFYWEDKDYEQSLSLLRRLVVDFPKQDYWLRMAVALAELDRAEESVVAMQLADLGGYMSSGEDTLRLVKMEFLREMPFPAAQRLQAAIEKGELPSDRTTLELLAGCWLAARDRGRSLEPLSEAAELAPDGTTWLWVAQIEMQLEDWDGAVAALDKALAKGSLDDAGKAYLLLGIVQYSRKQIEPARAAFEDAAKFSSTSDAASRWLQALGRTDATETASAGATGNDRAASQEYAAAGPR
jgi:tetratricopeptide (TPR) repeat protein